MARKIFFVGFVLLFICTVQILAQTCAEFPADCPDNGHENWGTRDDSISRLNNPVLPQEIVMENRLRNHTSDVIKKIAQKKGWAWNEISESSSSGQSKSDGTIIPYDYRAPHWCSFTFQCIVNKDSLQAWKGWLEEFSQRKLNESKVYASSTASDEGILTSYMDSANYYGQLKSKYMTDHMQEYQQALANNNTSAIKAFEKAMSGYDQKINSFVAKASNTQKKQDSKMPDGNMERREGTIQFRDGSLLQIEIGYNMENAATVGTLEHHESNGLPGVALINHYRNKEPDLQDALNRWSHSRNLTLMLIGNWSLIPDHYGTYKPAYLNDKKNTDNITSKKIKSDQVQTICIHLSGNNQAIHQFLSAFSAMDLTSLIVK
jgi:hypothetical protein